LEQVLPGWQLPAKATTLKIVVLAASFAAFFYYGFLHYPPVAPHDADVAELIRQAHAIGAAWRDYHNDRKFGQPRELKDRTWSDGAEDLEPYLGVLPTPPTNLVDAAGGYSYWIPVLLDDVAISAGPQGYAPPGEVLSGFFVRLDQTRSDACRAVAQASGHGMGIPYEVTGRGDWGRAAKLEAGHFTCVWVDHRQSGKFSGSVSFVLFRVI
jgi:hypothetical protein